jgi:predicted HNH restriction endonuclease
VDDRLERTIRNLRNWDELAIFYRNVQNKNALTDEITAAIRVREVELGRAYVAEKTGLALSHLSPAEDRIVQACAEYASVLRRNGKHPRRTIDQIRNNGLIGAAENAVSRGGHTQGYQTLADEDLQELSYEQIIMDHAEEFSPRALWYARRTLGFPNAWAQPPAGADNVTQSRCLALMDWYEQTAAECRGTLAGHTNSTLAGVLGLDDMRAYGRVMGNIQSRIDFACYEQRVPPLGLTAETPFAEAWDQGDRRWAFPVLAMQRAAKTRRWTGEDFDAIRGRLERLPGQAYISWTQAIGTNEEDLRTWAFSLDAESQEHTRKVRGRPTGEMNWSHDELILAFECYLQYRPAIPEIGTPPIRDLAIVLGEVRKQIGGVYDSDLDAPSVRALVQSFDSFELNQAQPAKKTNRYDAWEVWTLFSGNPQHLVDVARGIRAALQDAEAMSSDDIDASDTEEAVEGRLLTRSHRSRERNRQLVATKKKRALKADSVLRCEACGFHFASKYGAQSETIIDCHHTKPVHTLREGDKTHLDDLALLCANCHRVIHASRPWLTITELKARLAGGEQEPTLPASGKQ